MRILLCLIFLFFACANAQNITNKAMRTLFKYADTNVTDKLTTAINKETNVTVRIQKVKSWIDTNLVKKGVTVPKGAIEGNKTATQARAKGFLNHRETLNKLITKLLDGVKSVVPVEKAKENFLTQISRC
ncbi:hypothetical protein OESDEN_22987 [Oesophagostomum dentatum]|uniref:SXP/RAL-2 family protein Ani s 5-like cation-binding domain-containing protein n=1 Tax=Oesophagostomum dentatum TaxID=61180 RepID=A0A0B1RWE1_OESDE|nr:hypothetical protein OESDEN_22987 [Oesophagostomum dentatum]